MFRALFTDHNCFDLLLELFTVGNCDKPLLGITILRPVSRLLVLYCVGSDTNPFVDWLRKENVYMPKIKLDQNSCGLRGVVATEDIDYGESFLKVPRDLSLYVTEDEQCTMNDFIDPELWSQETWYVKLALKLLREKYLDKLSKWKPYIDVLPKALSTGLVYWSPSELAQLQYSLLIEEVQRYQSYRQALYLRIIESLPSKSWLQDETHLFWALDMVQSRAFGIPQNGNRIYVLLPMMDMLNHRKNSQTHLTYDSDKDHYEMRTYSKLPRGSDIYISYGPLSNDHLLHFYGT